MGTRAAAFETDPSVVDQATAVRVEGVEISHYIVDKNYNQFRAGFMAAHQRQPGAVDTEAWFRLFLAQLALKAHLAATGYLERPEIAATVAQMSRYILTKNDGPLYATLYDHRPLAPERLRAARALSSRVFDALIVRFDDDDAARRWLGPAGDAAALRLGVSRELAAATEADVSDGEIRWPFHPFEEITTELAGAKPGVALGPIRRGLGTYYLLVRGERRSEATAANTDAQLEKGLRLLDDDLVRRQRRARILRTCAFAVNAAAVEDATARLQRAEGPSATIAPEIWAPLGDTALASYRLGHDDRRITARDFAEDFNHRLVRRKPHTEAELREALATMLVEEYDDRAARELGLDRTPKFVEDRRNFALNQALAAYEQETLRPRLHVTPPELAAYAAAHADRYRAPAEAEGTLYVFAEPAAANRARGLIQQGDLASAAALAQRVVDRFSVRRDDAPLANGLPNQVVIGARDGMAFGPIVRGGQPVVFLKRASGQPVDPPFAAIESRVRREFERAKLDEAELILFQHNSAAKTLQLRLDPARYGLPASFLAEFGPTAPEESAGSGFRSDRANAREGPRPVGADKTKTTTQG